MHRQQVRDRHVDVTLVVMETTLFLMRYCYCT